MGSVTAIMVSCCYNVVPCHQTMLLIQVSSSPVSDSSLSELTVSFPGSISSVNADAWNTLAGLDYPFLRHEFLLALEQTGATSAASGWQPLHMLVENADGKLLALMPLYAKTNSMGEYVFDWSWADAYARHGLDYYPKLLTAIPFTPCAGPRLCIAEDSGVDNLPALVVAQLRKLATRIDASGWHLLFPEQSRVASFAAEGMLTRQGCQYQWFNENYRDFDDFLQGFNSRKRKNLKKERSQVASQGITLQQIEGPDITEDLWHHFYRFYESTYWVRGRAPYLSADFFLAIGKSMADRLMLVLARKDDLPVAGALYFKGRDTLYGRYWGSDREYPCLHFETCYYQGIDYAIRHGYQRIDSGAQGEHKIQRGFKPVTTWSVHWLRHPDFHRAVGDFVKEEAQHIDKYREQASAYLPFRKDLSPQAASSVLDTNSAEDQ
jgi:predicted N-acyltransferase